MNRPFARALLHAALLGVAAIATAQTGAPPARPDPLDAQATVPTVPYRSALSPYRKLNDEATLSWREANDTVAGIGGWRAYAREAQSAERPASPGSGPAAPPPAPNRPASAPAPSNDGAHRMH
jgi:hypothetical protein